MVSHFAYAGVFISFFFFSHFATIGRKSETLQPMMVYFPVAIKKNQDSISELSVILVEALSDSWFLNYS